MAWNPMAEGIIEMAKQDLIGNVLIVAIGFLEDDDEIVCVCKQVGNNTELE